MNVPKINLDVVERAISRLEDMRTHSSSSELTETLTELRRVRRVLRIDPAEEPLVSSTALELFGLLADIEDSSLGTAGAQALRARTGARARGRLARHHALLAAAGKSGGDGSVRARGGPSRHQWDTDRESGLSTVRGEVIMRLEAGDRTYPVPASLTYRSDDPFAVHVSMHVGAGETVDWVFGRGLLFAGLRKAAGCGDVRIWPGFDAPPLTSDEGGVIDFVPDPAPRERRRAPHIFILLSSPEGDALLRTERSALRAFLRKTQAEIPFGAELTGPRGSSADDFAEQLNQRRNPRSPS
ncbi:hypothetical protein GCM10010441_55410 [Kitasatospora paracochleata]|uniref:Sporulation and cell division protein SsgA n=1 Tax=Kitasatospora paracochleata TaxID=58354 RepID=A0ABT1J6F2_9ACTN|nr:SsgA family sporulation/cell division regulator [Kitasatospora paracochleata]MCP2313017.1 hypothetical protein [Kitasatospora paracochleata]